MKPPKFNGKTPFETFYAQYLNAAKFNHWNRDEQLAHLKNSLTDVAAQILWDSGPETTNSLSKLVKLLKTRFSGDSQCDKYRMEVRG